MSRLYAYKECEVLVLPQRVDLKSFPKGTGAALLRKGIRMAIRGREAVILNGDGKGVAVPLAATDGNTSPTRPLTGAELTIGKDCSPVDGRVGEVIEAKVGDGRVVVHLSNVCAWGRVNMDPYEQRGW
jgi:hypothetical protein